MLYEHLFDAQVAQYGLTTSQNRNGVCCTNNICSYLPSLELSGATHFSPWNVGYNAVEYVGTKISSTSNTPYFDLSVIPDKNTGIEIVFSISDKNYVTNKTIQVLGARNAKSTSTSALGIAGSSSQTTWQVNIGGTTCESGFNRAFDKDVRIKIFPQNENQRKVIFETDLDANVPTATEKTIDCSQITENGTLKLYLFTWNGDNAAYSSIRVKYCKIFDGTTLARDLVPCLHSYMSQIVLYDFVDRKFIAPSGSGWESASGVPPVNIIPSPEHRIDIVNSNDANAQGKIVICGENMFNLQRVMELTKKNNGGTSGSFSAINDNTDIKIGNLGYLEKKSALNYGFQPNTQYTFGALVSATSVQEGKTADFDITFKYTDGTTTAAIIYIQKKDSIIQCSQKITNQDATEYAEEIQVLLTSKAGKTIDTLSFGGTQYTFTAYITNIMLLTGAYTQDTWPKTYIPFYKTEFAIPSGYQNVDTGATIPCPLARLNDNCVDQLKIDSIGKTIQYYQMVHEMTFDSQDKYDVWQEGPDTDSTTGIYHYLYQLSDNIQIQDDIGRCNYFNMSTETAESQTNVLVIKDNCLNIYTNIATNLTEWQEWLANINEPLKIQCGLQQPIIHSIPLSLNEDWESLLSIPTYDKTCYITPYNALNLAYGNVQASFLVHASNVT